MGGRGRRSNVIALPNARLSPLFNDHEPLPPVPFLRGSAQLHRSLRWGAWRELLTGRSYQGRNISQEALESAATRPEQEEIRLAVNINEVQYEVLIRPGTRGATTVTVSDVVGAVEYEARRVASHRPAGGAYPYNGQAIRRGSNGVWEWCGLDMSPGEDDVWVLYL